MSGPKVVLWRPMYNQIGHKLLTDGGAVVAVVDTPDTQAVMKELTGARALWVRTPERVSVEMLDAASELIAISTSGFGKDNIPIPEATGRGIIVFNHQGFGRTPVAEHVLMLILASLKRLVWGHEGTRDGSAWGQRTEVSVHELEGRTVGLIGLGYIGSELAKKLRLGFNCRVLAYDPYANPRIGLLAGAGMVGDLKSLLKQSQVLCLCAELTDETRGMIGSKELNALPSGAVVVNCARGQMLDLDALVAALDSGHLHSAGLDVTFPEPLPQGHPVLRHPRITVTPHTAGVSEQATAGLARSAAEQIFAALRGEMPRFALNPEAWEGKTSRRPKKA